MISWLKLKCPFLFEEKMPIWLTIILSISAALGAYFLSPMINREFQVDEVRSQHMAKTTQDLNDEIVALSEKVRRLNDALINNPKDVPAIRSDCLDLITKLQWSLVDLNVVLNSKEDQLEIEKLSSSIKKVQIALTLYGSDGSQKRLMDSMGSLADSTESVLNRLYKRAHLK